MKVNRTDETQTIEQTNMNRPIEPMNQRTNAIRTDNRTEPTQTDMVDRMDMVDRQSDPCKTEWKSIQAKIAKIHNPSKRKKQKSIIHQSKKSENNRPIGSQTINRSKSNNQPISKKNTIARSKTVQAKPIITILTFLVISLCWFNDCCSHDDRWAMSKS